MSRRTAEANKAILEAWNKEQELVQEGRGTREWTIEQQKDILEKGKAYDDIGVAFQGQHMKSVEEYPEYQGDYRNIQFLSREEHLEAHNGNWRNPTNWYFDPVTKEKKDFGEGPYIPCEIIQLKDSSKKNENIRKAMEGENKKLPENNSCMKNQNVTQVNLKNSKVNSNSKIRANGEFKKHTKPAVEKIDDFLNKHPIVKKTIEIFATGFAAGLISKLVTENNTSKFNKSTNPDSHEKRRDIAINKINQDDVVDDFNRSSPKEHIVRSHGQHYHTKSGSIWREKDSYPRGGIKDE